MFGEELLELVKGLLAFSIPCEVSVLFGKSSKRGKEFRPFGNVNFVVAS